MLQELDGKVAVITGGGSGIGASLARACAAAGMRVVVVDVNEERAAAVAAELPDGTAVARAVDVSDADRVQALADFAFDTFGAVHLLCNNAGISPVGRVWDFTDDEWQYAARRQRPRRRQRHPQLRAPHDRAGRGPHRQHRLRAPASWRPPRLGPYCATKHAIVGLSEALRYELDGTGIGVSVLVPAGVNTNIGDAMVRPSATDPDAVADDFTVLTGALDPTSLEMIEPDVVADVTLVGVREGWDYIVMGPGQSVGVERRYGEVLDAHRRSKERFPFLP